MGPRVSVAPGILDWAARRSNIGNERLYNAFPRWDEWVAGTTLPTLKQLENIARTTHTPVGYFYLPEPVRLMIPIPDFRRMDRGIGDEASPDLLDVIHAAQLRQAWYREYARNEATEPLEYVNSVSTSDDVLEIAAEIRKVIRMDRSERERVQTFSDMIRLLRERIEEIGVLVFISGIVGSDTHRTLDPAEFRGFALVDDLAPVIFVNGADTKAAQIFTLVHELAHLWVGSTGLSDVSPEPPNRSTEIWCNSVSAEVLVPIAELRNARDPSDDLQNELQQLARLFKVSTLVILRRMYDERSLNREDFRTIYDAELQRLLDIEPRGTSTGGNFYSTTLMRTGHRFAQAIIGSAWEGRTTFTEALRMLGFKSMATLREMSHRLSVYG